MLRHLFCIPLALGALVPGAALGTEASLHQHSAMPSRSLATHWASVGFHPFPPARSEATVPVAACIARLSPPSPSFFTAGPATDVFSTSEACAPTFNGASFFSSAAEVFSGTFVGWGIAVSRPDGQPGRFTPEPAIPLLVPPGIPNRTLIGVRCSPPSRIPSA